jgi:hypothetical protein
MAIINFLKHNSTNQSLGGMILRHKKFTQLLALATPNFAAPSSTNYIILQKASVPHLCPEMTISAQV